VIKLKNDSGYNEDQIRDNFNGTNGHTGAHIDKEGVVRWNSNDEIPFEDMLADFRTLDLINEENQLHSNLLREKETEEFWDDYVKEDENGMSIGKGRLW
jgi:kynurenine formamidase